MRMVVDFKGGLADDHKLPAYEGAKSIEGITRSALIVSNYIVEGRVRRKDFGNEFLAFNIVSQQPGSFDLIYEILYTSSAIVIPVIGDAIKTAASDLLADLLKTVYTRVTGGTEKETPETVKALEEEKSGDIAALVDAIEPSVRLGHNVINNGVITININYGAPAQESNIAKFNMITKAYLNDNRDDDTVESKLFSISVYNANQQTGRAFDLEELRSIPFILANSADVASVNCLMRSISRYALGRKSGDRQYSAVAVQYTTTKTVDGRVKRIKILKVRDEISQL